jgi:hypothetical protein
LETIRGREKEALGSSKRDDMEKRLSDLEYEHELPDTKKKFRGKLEDRILDVYQNLKRKYGSDIYFPKEERVKMQQVYLFVFIIVF